MSTKAISLLAKGICVAALGVAVLAPVAAGAQASRDQQSHHRQQKKNEWRNIAIGSGGLAVLGLVKHNNTLMLAGAAGALYSANRYEQDRKSQSKTDRARAAFYSKSRVYHNGHQYNRKTVWVHGKKHYRFVRA